MSVNYSLAAATANGFSIIRVIFLWKGSVWKLVWREVSFWILMFAIVNIIYYYIIKGTRVEDSYEFLLHVVERYPLDGTMMFLLSYLTFNSLKRWSNTYKLLMWPENIALLFQQHFNEKCMSKEEAKKIRCTIVRYIILFYILIFRDVSTEVRTWFPTLEHFVQSNILTKSELDLMNSTRLSGDDSKYWVPLNWIGLVLKKRYKKKYVIVNGKRVRRIKESIMTEVGLGEFISELCVLRSTVSDILSYDWVPIPILFVQTITVVVYSNLIMSTFKMQHRMLNVEQDQSIIQELFVECISTLPFNVLYLSFLRISQVVINPFGSDDDDFETAYLVERHLTVLQELLLKDTSVDEANGKACFAEKGLHHTVASALLQDGSKF